MSTIVTRAGKGSALTWTEADANFTNLNTDKLEASLLADTGGSSLVGFIQAGTGAVATDVQSKLREVKSLSDFGWSPLQSTADQFIAVEKAWVSALANEHDILHPGGVCDVGIYSLPFGRINGLPPTSLLDCKNVTIYGVGPRSVFKTSSISGADVLQLNGAKNLHIRNVKITATISGSDAGSNGISITGGYDNVTLDHIWCENLPSVDKTIYIDGGKALTIQTPISSQTVNCGTLKATNIFAKGCVYGFGLEVDLVAASTMDTSVDVDIVVEDCREAVIVSAGAATGAISDSWTMGVRVRAQAINCMKDVVLTRAHGVDVECQVITTKTKDQRILNYAGTKWFASDTIADVVALRCSYAHDSRISMTGNKGACASIAQIGGILGGSSGLTPKTHKTQFYLDVLGTSASGDIVAVDEGGNIASECTFVCQGTGTPAAAFYAPADNNAVVAGNLQTLKDLSVQGAVKFTYTDGVTSYAEINYDDEAMTFKQTFGSVPSLQITKHLNSVGNQVFGVRNDGAITTAGRITATSVSLLTGVLPVYTESNVLYGYVPVYASKS